MKKNIQNVSTYNDFIEDIVNNPERIYDCIPDGNIEVIQSALINLSRMSIRGYKLLDYIFVTGYSFDDKNYFIQELIDEELLINYIKSIEKREDRFLKAMAYTYLEPIEFKEMYEDLSRVVHDLTYEGDYNLVYRVNALIDFSNQYGYRDDNILDLVKKSIISIVNNDSSFKSSRTKEDVNEYIKNAIDKINKSTMNLIYM